MWKCSKGKETVTEKLNSLENILQIKCWSRKEPKMNGITYKRRKKYIVMGKLSNNPEQLGIHFEWRIILLIFLKTRSVFWEILITNYYFNTYNSFNTYCEQ